MRALIIIIILLSCSSAFAQKEYLVLASGNDSVIDESYIVTKARLDSLPLINFLDFNKGISIEKIIEIAYFHLKEKYPSDTLVFSSLRIERFAEEDFLEYFPNGFTKDWVALVFFQYNNNKSCQAIPVLFDGSIVKGSNE